MLSILLPVFNRDIRQQVHVLHKQALDTGIPFEIICIDDGSESHFCEVNRELGALPFVSYRALSENIGRAAIRNLLADNSRYEYLLFMDADFQLLRKDYLSAFLVARSPHLVLVGGSCYPGMQPREPELVLRWRYGVAREQLSVEKRRKMGWRAFTTHHFFLSRAAFEKVRFDETLRTYGHEDTLFGTALAKAGFQIRHLDNPLMHLEIDPAEVYLKKVEESITNLYRLQMQGKQLPSGLWQAFSFLRLLKLDGLVAKSFPVFAAAIQRQLSGSNPLLFLLDWYKLSLLCHHAKSERHRSE